MDEARTITIEEFAKMAGVSSDSAKARFGDLRRQGAHINENGTIVLPYGARYPYNAGRTKYDSAGKRYYTILKATSKFQYIDAETINVYPEDFSAMLHALVDADMLVPNGIDNPHGANGYVCSLAVDDLLKKRARAAAKLIEETIVDLGVKAAREYLASVAG